MTLFSKENDQVEYCSAKHTIVEISFFAKKFGSV